MVVWTRLLTALPANTLNKQACFFSDISYGQDHSRNTDVIEACSLSTQFALKMNVIVMVVPIRTSFPAERIFSSALIVQHFMEQSLIQKRPQCTVNSHAVVIRT